MSKMKCKENDFQGQAGIGVCVAPSLVKKKGRGRFHNLDRDLRPSVSWAELLTDAQNLIHLAANCRKIKKDLQVSLRISNLDFPANCKF